MCAGRQSCGRVFLAGPRELLYTIASQPPSSTTKRQTGNFSMHLLYIILWYLQRFILKNSTSHFNVGVIVYFMFSLIYIYIYIYLFIRVFHNLPLIVIITSFAAVLKSPINSFSTAGSALVLTSDNFHIIFLLFPPLYPLIIIISMVFIFRSPMLVYANDVWSHFM